VAPQTETIITQGFAEHPPSRASVFAANTANSNGNGVRTQRERSTNVGVLAPVRDCSRNSVAQRLVAALRERGGPL